MLKIGVWRDAPRGRYGTEPERLMINGIRVPESTGHQEKDQRYSGGFPTWDSLVEHLGQYSVRVLAQHFKDIYCNYPSPWEGHRGRVIVRLSDKNDPSTWRLALLFFIDVTEWTGPWSVRAYIDTVENVLADTPDCENVIPYRQENEDFPPMNALSFVRPIQSHEADVQDEAHRLLKAVRPVVEQARGILAAEVERDTLVALFDFAPTVSTACEQYLLYFVQFLKDLGIEANAALKHEAHKVLFSVTPNEGPEALERIRHALEVYLQLPGSPEFGQEASQFPDVAVQQLQANVFHLQSQLALAGAMLQAKNAQNEALQLSNFRYQQLLADSRQVERLSIPSTLQKPADKESLVEGVVSVTPYEGKGFVVELPEILRRLKRTFGSGPS